MKGVLMISTFLKNFFQKGLLGIYHNFLLSYRQIRRGDRNVMVFIIYGLLYDVFLNLYKPFSVKFLDRVGGTAFHISLLNSLPGFLAVFALIPGAVIINRFRRKKGVISVFFGISRAFVLMLVFIPYMPEALRPILFVVLMSAMNFPDAISQSGLQGFLGDVFNGVDRSRAITLRNKFGQMVAMAVTLSTGFIVMLVPKNEAQTITVYQVLFAAAVVFGIAEIFVFMRFKEPQKESPEGGEGGGRPSLKSGFKAVLEPLKDRKFVAYMIPTIYFYFMYQAGWPLFSILQVIDLKATEFHMALNAALAGICGFLGANFWGRRIAKKGNDFTTVIATLLLAVSVFLTILSPNIWVYILCQGFGGFVGIGVVITMFNGLLAATPDKNRVIYIAVFNTFVNLSLGLSPLFANVLYEAMGTRQAMAVMGLGRLLSTVILYVIYLRNKRKVIKSV
ncbi:MAG: MFS transporter [Clostridiales bacterium]|jgi:MFS family permease|nr:MFS transporter [Clostridiales bacterium]